MRTLAGFLLIMLFWIRCANIQTPSGGPKDKKAPKLVSSTPKSNQTNFKSKTVELTFNETIKLNNPKEEIIISPSPGKEIEFRSKGVRLMITPKESWKDSTTYSILFREGVQDITENNSPSNLKLAFSTGPHIDSLTLSGNIVDLLEGTPKEKMTVAIYDIDTFDIFTSTPNFFTKTDKRGNFKLDNIKAGRYRIYAFDDKNKNLKVESRAEMYGFITNYLNLRKDIDTLSIGVIRLDSRPLTLSSIRNIGTITRLRFSKYLTHVTVIAKQKITHAFGDNQTEVNLWNPTGPDSLQVQVSGSDSLQNSIDTIFYIKRTDIKPVKEKFTWSIGHPTINPESARLLTVMKFSKPLANINLDSLYIEIDSANLVHFTEQDISYDQQQKQITVTKDLSKKLFGADQDPRLKVIARPGFAYSMDNDTTKALSGPILIYWPEENGTLSIQAVTKEKNYILQVLDKSSRKIVAQAVNLPRLIAKNIPPSDYQIRIILDDNNNGKWDPGNIKKGVEPEKVIYYKAADGAVSFPIRANWELGPLLLNF